MKKQDKAAPKKIYQEIAAYLMEQIESGKLKLGDAIYSEHTLCRLFNASRTSVRRAIREMVENNILVQYFGIHIFRYKDVGNGKNGPNSPIHNHCASSSGNIRPELHPARRSKNHHE